MDIRPLIQQGFTEEQARALALLRSQCRTFYAPLTDQERERLAAFKRQYEGER